MGYIVSLPNLACSQSVSQSVKPSLADYTPEQLHYRSRTILLSFEAQEPFHPGRQNSKYVDLRGMSAYLRRRFSSQFMSAS